MCLIIASQDGILPDEELLRIAQFDNSHGWGVMWPEEGKVRAVKGFTINSLLRNVKKHKGTPFVVHMRWATHGDINHANCHPFKITGDLWMAHNGVLSVPIKDKSMSDSWHFAQELKYILHQYPWMRSDVMTERLLRYTEFVCGYSNKVAFLRGDGRILIANEARGVKYQGLWLSNEHSLPNNRAWRDYYFPEPVVTSPATEYGVRSIADVPKESFQQKYYAFAEDGDLATFDTMQDCEYCAQSGHVFRGFEGSLLCEDCYQWAVREADLYRRSKWDDARLDALDEVELEGVPF